MKPIFTVTTLIALAVLIFSGCDKQERELSSLADAKNARIGVMVGTTGEIITRQKFPHAQIKSFDDIMDGIAAIKSGQLDAIVTVYTTALQVVKKNPGLKILAEPLSHEDSSIALKKGNDAMLASLNRIIDDLDREGILADMKRRWVKTGLEPYEEKNIPASSGSPLLKVGVCATREPVSFVDASGRVTGHDGELARIIGARLGRPVEFHNMKFMALIPALQSGKIDLIISGMSPTEERKKSIDFTRSYFANSQIMLVKKSASTADDSKQDQPKTTSSPPLDGASSMKKAEASAPDRNPGGIARIHDISGKRICVLTGSAGDLAARRHFSGSGFQAMTAAADAALALKTGKADAFIYDRSVLLNLVRNNPELIILDEPVDRLEVAAALKKENNGLLADINRVLEQLKAEGVLQQLRNTWVDTKYAAPPALPPAGTPGTAPPLRMGTCANLEPFSFHTGNELTGLDIALSRMIGERLGRTIVIADMNFEALIPALQAGKIDFALSNFNVTDERKKLISFSLPYIENDISALVKRGEAASVKPEDVSPAASHSDALPGIQYLKTRIGVLPGSTRADSFFSGLAESFHSNIILEKRYLLLWDGLKTTVIISIFATIFGTLLAAPVCFMRMSKRAALNLPARVYIAILRGTPVLVLLMLTFYVVFASVQINPVLVAIIAFGMNFAAYAAEIFRSGIEGIDRGQAEAGIALGFTRFSTFRHIILPQTARRILPVYKGEFISLVKMTSIVGYIAVQDLTKASDIIRSRTFDAFFPLIVVAVLYFGISWLLMQSLEYLERQTDPHIRRRKRMRARTA